MSAVEEVSPSTSPPKWITRSDVEQVISVRPRFGGKELTSDELTPLLLTLSSKPPLLSSTRRRKDGQPGRYYVNKTAQKALKEAGIPTIGWHARGQFFVRIGYRRSSSGLRQRAFFYLGVVEKVAIAKAAALKYAWRELKKKHGAKAVWSDRSGDLPDRALSDLTPVEAAAAIDRHHSEMAEEALDQGEVRVYSRDPSTGRTMRMDADPSDTVVEQSTRLRIEQVREMYLEYRKGKLGILGGQGVNEKSFINEFRNLKAALISADPRTLINTLGYAEIERLRDSIFRRVGTEKSNITKRTANNYWKELQRMLNWAHRQASVNYRHPEDINDLFKQRFRNPNPVKIAVYDAKQLKKLLEKASDRQRLYIYLALNPAILRSTSVAFAGMRFSRTKDGQRSSASGQRPSNRTTSKRSMCSGRRRLRC